MSIIEEVKEMDDIEYWLLNEATLEEINEIANGDNDEA